MPSRDRGIDLVAYRDLGVRHFIAKPIQMRSFWREGIYLERKLAKFPDLILVLVLYVGDPAQQVIYALPCRDAIKLIDGRRLKWSKRGSFYRGPLGKELSRDLQQFKTTLQRWQYLIKEGK